MMGRLLDGRTPVRSEGYYLLKDQNEVVFSQSPPDHTELVTLESFTNALVEGCKQVVRSFAESSENKEVYAVSLDLFYRTFPDTLRLDEQFAEEMIRNRQLSVGDSIAYWSDAIHSDYALEPPFTYLKPAMEVFVQLEHYGSELTEECLDRLAELSSLDNLDRRDYEKMAFYIEALYFCGPFTVFCGPFTVEQKEVCIGISQKLTKEDEDDVLNEYAKELASIAS